MTQTKKPILKRILDSILKDTLVRTFITQQSHSWFFSIYFSDYVEYETAPFQHEMFALTERQDWHLLCLMAFRGSAKSTIMNTSYALWSILGTQQKKYVLILCQTRTQAKQYMMNIRGAVERDSLLKKDLGPFKEEGYEWGSSSLVFSKYDARVTVASSEQSIRGTRHNQHRPDLVIIDDAEDTQSVKTKEGRQKTYNWFKSEVIPAGGKRTRYIVIGNLLNEGCLVSRLISEINDGELDGIWRAYPLVDNDGNIAWPGKYPTMEDVEKERKRVGNEIIWQREYLLNLVPDSEQIIDPKWIKRYVEMPRVDSADYVCTLMAIDPAVTESDTADYTAIVFASVFGYGDDRKIYIHPRVINQRLSYFKSKNLVKQLANAQFKGQPIKIIVEGGGFQKALFQELEREGYWVEIMNTGGIDKQERLMIASGPTEGGQVYFPLRGTEDLERQIIRFGIEKYDDLADAYSMVIRGATEFRKPATFEIMTLYPTFA